MFKNNKKGFSLIEMMIVIAVVAVLVSIIIPVVGNSKVKAAAATNAANLRQAQGAIQTLRLLEPNQFSLLTAQTAANEKFTFGTAFADAPNAQAISIEGMNLEADAPMRATREGDDIVVTYRGYTIEMFATIAETGSISGVSIGTKNEMMNDLEDYNKELDILTNALKEEGLLSKEAQAAIDKVADEITNAANSIVNSSEDPDPDALKGVDIAMGALDQTVGPLVCTCCKAGTFNGGLFTTFCKNTDCGHTRVAHW